MRSWREVLRGASEASHRRLDNAFAEALMGLDDYVRLVQLLHALHAAADPLLTGWAASYSTFSQLTIPSREPAFAADLGFLGAPTLDRVDLDALPRTSSGGLTDPAGIALLYVVAGSSIGARVLIRRLPDTVPLPARSGLEQGAAAQSAALWSAVLPFLTLPASDDDAASAGPSCAYVFDQLLGVLNPV